MKKRHLITIAVIVVVLILTAIMMNKSPTGNVTKTIAQYIGSNSILYVQKGCHACEIQEEMFGEDIQYITIIDCFYERDKCEGITATPTWIINGETYTGVQSIEKLKELTGYS